MATGLTGAAADARREQIFNESREAMEKAGFTPLKIAKELKILSFSDIANYLQISPEGAVKAVSLEELKRGSSKAIRKIKEKRRIMETKGGAGEIVLEDTFEFELYSKLEALKMAAELMGMEQPKRHELTGKDGAPLVPPPALLFDFGGKDAK